MPNNRNRKNGTGEGISEVLNLTAETEFTDSNSFPRGFKTKVNGLVKVTLADMDTPIETYCVAGAYNNYIVKVAHADGAVLLTDIEFYL